METGGGNRNAKTLEIRVLGLAGGWRERERNENLNEIKASWGEIRF